MNDALGLAALCVVMFGPAGPLLARARWTHRAPRAAVALWQSIGICGALAAIGFGLSVTVLPAHAGLRGGVERLVRQAMAGRPLQGLGISGSLGLTLASDVCMVLVIGLVATGVRTTVDRARHRRLLDLVSHSVDEVPDVHVLDDPRVTAYCLPGVRPRIVVSAGALDLLSRPEIGAVIAHERGHAHGRHGVVMLPFTSMDSLLRWMPYARHARSEVALLLEMAADDFAARLNRPQVLAGALLEMSLSGASPTCAFAAGSTAAAERIHRLLRPGRISARSAALAVAASAVVLALPFVALA
jgi:Zn-dependent protease with chaperone function